MAITNKQSFSRLIIRIAIAAIALGVVMMLIAIATGVGLKYKIREKVAAFNGHIQISSSSTIPLPFRRQQ